MRATSARREPAKHRKTLLAKAPHPGVAFAIREVEKARLRRGREGGRRHTFILGREDFILGREDAHEAPFARTGGRHACEQRHAAARTMTLDIWRGANERARWFIRYRGGVCWSLLWAQAG